MNRSHRTHQPHANVLPATGSANPCEFGNHCRDPVRVDTDRKGQIEDLPKESERREPVLAGGAIIASAADPGGT